MMTIRTSNCLDCTKKCRGSSGRCRVCYIKHISNDEQPCAGCGTPFTPKNKRLHKYCKPECGRLAIKQALMADLGTVRQTKDGYRQVRVIEGWEQEHRYVMEQHLGFPLADGETVHHKNGVRNDNRLENLELWSGSQPSGQRVVDKLVWARELIERFEKIEDKL